MTSDEGTVDGPRFDVDEGWFTDPWSRHEARWISLGKATDLVRDGDIESRDAPPSSPPTATPSLVRTNSSHENQADDVKRADDAEDGFMHPGDLRQRLADAAEEGIDSSF
jgi:hypothetical protein